MTTQRRLFARTLEQRRDVEQLSLENVIIALLDIYTNDTSLRQELYRLPNCHYFRANTINNCLDLIVQREAENVLIILIISNRFLDFVRQNLIDIVPQLSFIYLFDSVLCNQRFSTDQRFRGTFDNIDSLLRGIDRDIKEVRHLRRLDHGIQFISEESTEFFWYRFFFNVLNRLQHTDIAKREILPRLRDYYHVNRHELVNIDEFEREYRFGKGIWWYTRDTFFYRSLNRALRQKDIHEIFLWRVFIQDLDMELRQLRRIQEHRVWMSLYRGQSLYIDDINKLKENVGKLITMRTFLSTSLDKDVASVFIDHSRSNSMLSLVLVTINVNSNDVRGTFADIHSISAYSLEREFLFSLRSLFRIDRVEFANDLWHIDLTAVDEDDQEFCQAINPWKAKISEQSFFSGRHEPLFTRYLTNENSSFLAVQLLIDLMLRLHQTDYAREEMIEMCRRKYSDSFPDLNKIDEFERTYNHQDAAKWYTTDSFLYRLLNSSLRLEDIDTLFKLRYYIYDLHNQLAQSQTAYIESLPTKEPILTLYRGQRMRIEELNKIRKNVGKLISKNSFLSTTSDFAAAVFFSGDDSLEYSDTETSVVYQITVDTRESHTIPFAKIQYASIFKDEDEVLFSIAAVFRIDNVEQRRHLWVVDLTLINKEDETWSQLTAHLKR